jgi:hypothetical protein
MGKLSVPEVQDINMKIQVLMKGSLVMGHRETPKLGNQWASSSLGSFTFLVKF